MVHFWITHFFSCQDGFHSKFLSSLNSYEMVLQYWLRFHKWICNNIYIYNSYTLVYSCFMHGFKWICISAGFWLETNIVISVNCCMVIKCDPSTQFTQVLQLSWYISQPQQVVQRNKKRQLYHQKFCLMQLKSYMVVD